MSIEKARLLIRVANQINNESDKEALLKFADEILAGKINESKIIHTADENSSTPIFRKYKGKMYTGKLFRGGRIEFNGKEYKSPSGGAVQISGHNENGWRMWRYIDQSTNKDEPIEKLRNSNW